MQKLDAGMEACAVDDQQAADGHDEREREHLHLGVAVDEVRDGVDEDHHEEHGQHDGDDHDDEVVGHAHGRDDRVDGEDEIHDHDGAHGLRQRDTVQRLVFLAVLGFELGQLERVAQLGDTLVYKVAAADEQHEVAHRESVRVRPEVDGEQRRGHVHEERCEAQKQDAHDQGTGQAELTADVLLVLGQAVRRDRYEHQVVHAEHDFQEDEADQADPCLG